MYKDSADTILGNCDTTLFLGGKEKTTLKEMSELLGKETIDLYNTSETRSNQKSFGLNYQKTGKQLMTEDEIAVMDGGKCIMQLRGVRPFFSNKFDITKHKQYRLLSDYDEKNAFDIEKYVKNLCKAKVRDNDTVDEVEDAGVIDPARVSHGGVKIGRVEFTAGNMARVRLERSLDDGDGLQIRTAQGDAELIYAGHDTEAGQIAVVRLRPDIRTKAGDEVYRLTSEKQLQWARSLAIPAIPADMALIAYPGKPLALTMTDGESSVTVTGDTVAPAQSRAMSEEDARRSLGKLSDTPFSLRALTVQTAGAFVPVSALNQLRREACQQLAEARIAAFTRKAGREETADDLIYPDTPDAPSMAIVRTREQADAMQGAADLLVWYPEDFRADALESGLRDMPDGVWLQLPTVCEEKTLDLLCDFVQRNAGKLGGIVLGSVGQLGRTWNVPMGAGSGIPVMNRRAAQFLLEQGCRFVTASSELSGAELRTLMQNHPPVVVPAYGREQLMLLHHCPARTYLGLTKGHAACRMCDQHSPDALAGQTLTDRRGTVYPLLRQRLPEGCLVRLMNALPTNNIRRVRQAGYAPMMVLTTENAQEAADVRAVMDGEMRELEGTSNHWNRPVE